MGKLIEDLQTLANTNTLTKLLASLFAFLLLVSALAVGTVEMLRGEQVNTYIVLVLGTGIGYALHALGLSSVAPVPVIAIMPDKEVKP